MFRLPVPVHSAEQSQDTHEGGPQEGAAQVGIINRTFLSDFYSTICCINLISSGKSKAREGYPFPTTHHHPPGRLKGSGPTSYGPLKYIKKITAGNEKRHITMR